MSGIRGGRAPVTGSDAYTLREQLFELRRFIDNLILQGKGTPEGVVAAKIGSLYRNIDGGALTTLWVKTSGTGKTGWTAK